MVSFVSYQGKHYLYLKAEFFNAVDDFYACAEDRGDSYLFPAGQVSTEIVLYRHLAHRDVPITYGTRSCRCD